jgi:mono/diheme cytochrome c family protein
MNKDFRIVLLLFTLIVYDNNSYNPIIHKTYSLRKGEVSYRKLCSHCHGFSGEGGIGPSLRSVKKNPQDIFRKITNGGDIMPKFVLKNDDLANLIGYLFDLD